MIDEFLSPEERAEAERARSERQAEQAREDWIWLLKNKRGRRIVWQVLVQCGVFHVSFTGEAATTFFAEGKRSIGLAVLAQVLDADPDAYGRMQREFSAGVDAE